MDHAFDAGRDVRQERHAVGCHCQSQGTDYAPEANDKRSTRPDTRPALFLVAFQRVHREIDAEGDHGNGHDELNDQATLKLDEVGYSLQPDHQDRESNSS